MHKKPPPNFAHRFPSTKRNRRVIFLGGNGFSVMCFTPLLNLLHKTHGFDVTALELLPLANDTVRSTPPEVYFAEKAPPSSNAHYHGFDGLGDDLLRYLEQEREPATERNTPIACIGWSMGATAAVFAAAKRPDLFAGGLVLLDPANLDPMLKPIHRLIPPLQRRHFEPVKSTLTRRTNWPSRDHFETQWLNKSRLVAKVADKSALKQHMVRPVDPAKSDGEVTLNFPKEWETHFFIQPSNLYPSLKKLRKQERDVDDATGMSHNVNKVPILAICAKPSLFCSKRDHTRMRQWNCQVEVFDKYTHLLPLEDPVLCANLAASFIR